MSDPCCNQGRFNEQQALRKNPDPVLKKAMRGDPKAQFNLGNCYGLGQGVTESRDTAVFWLTEAAKQGHAAAFELLKRISNSSAQK